MPFTGSHPAAVVPLMGTPLVPSALVVGSMVPDLPYYVPLPISFAFTHTLAGLVSVDLAMAVVCLAIWHLLFVPVSVALAPDALRRRLGPDLPRRPRDHAATTKAVALIVGSVLVGTLTHVVWDEFTHVDRWGARHIAWLAERHGPLDGYRWAQYASGVVGLAVIAVATWRWWQHTPASGHQRVPRLPRAVAIAVGAAVLGAVACGGITGLATGLHRGDGLSRALYDAATLGGGLGLLAALLCAAWCARLLRRAAASEPEVRGDG